MPSTFKEKTQDTISLIQTEYERSDLDWHVGFSGGKDSSALTVLLFNALLRTVNRNRLVNIIYCDTGVDIPIVGAQVKKTLKNLEDEARGYGLPIRVTIAEPELAERYFVKVIGRGYPPPTNIFRWCTRRLRISPIQKVISAYSRDCSNVVLLGLRNGESSQRDRAISVYSTEEKYYFRHSTNRRSKIFSPLLDYDVEEVWATIIDKQMPKSIDAHHLMRIYKDASGECPIIRDPKGSPCGKGRFGCWTCTVIRKDTAVTSLVEQGYENLAPLLAFRNWLIKMRDLPEYRCAKRRNGQKGPGPINLLGRQFILSKLLAAQQESGYSLIATEEIDEIKRLWTEDIKSKTYNRFCEETRVFSFH